MGVPGIAVAEPSVLVICRSACGVSVSVSVLLLSVRSGSVTEPGAVTVAVFDNEPVADALMVPVAVYVIVLPVGMLTVSLMLPLPLAVKPVAPSVAEIGR